MAQVVVGKSPFFKREQYVRICARTQAIVYGSRKDATHLTEVQATKIATQAAGGPNKYATRIITL